MNSLGTGILKGMAVTLKNFTLSYFDKDKKERLPTVQYPEEGNTVTPFSRNFPFLIYDGEDEIDGMRCVACQICERECPPACIYIVKEKDENGKFVKRPKVFDVDVSVCMGCQICVEVCPFDAIVMDSEFEYSNEDRFGALLFNRDQLLKSNDYYHEIHPDEARERDAHLAAKKAEEEAKKKAREEKAKQAAADKAAKEAAEKEAPQPEEAKAETPDASQPETETSTEAKDPEPAPVEEPKAEAVEDQEPAPAEKPAADPANETDQPDSTKDQEDAPSESGAEETSQDDAEKKSEAEDAS